MKLKRAFLISICVILSSLWTMAQDEPCDLEADNREYTDHYTTTDCRFRTRHYLSSQENPYFIMEPGWRVVLEGESDGELIRLETTVLNETERVAGVRTRVIEEVEYIDGELYEVARNFYAICTQTNDIYYFGEDVAFYEDGEIVSNDGQWRAGENGARPGVIMPGSVMIGARFQQEISPGEAMDRAEVMGFTTMQVEDMTFENVLMLLESNPFDTPCDAELKYYAPGIGNIVDEELEVVEAGFAFRVAPFPDFKQDP